MSDPDMFEPYDRLIEIEILGKMYRVPENNSILRCLQYLDMESISYGDFCWNGECLNCQVWIKNGQKEKAVIACRTNATEGMQIMKMSDQIPFLEEK
jgi:NADH dehydrogenase/NADH:ubiquinone oxidoreductase subunit G